MFLGKWGLGCFFVLSFLVIISFRKKFFLKSKVLIRLPFFLIFVFCWAIIPEILGKLSFGILKPVFTIFGIGDIFFFHAVLLRLHTTGAAWGLALLILSFYGFIFLYFRKLRRLEQELSRLKNKLEN